MIPFLKKNKDGKKPPKSNVPRTAQESIPFQRMFEDGTCRVRPGYYTRTIQYQDINYQLAQPEDRTAIFEEWCSFLNFFDSSIHFELSFVNTATDSADFEKSIRIPYQQDGFDDVRAEYSQMLRQQLSKGNNGLTKTKYLTYGIEGDSMTQVKPRLEHIQNDLMNNFHRLGVLAKPLDGTERLRLMHGMLNMDGASKFHFDWKDLVPSGLSVKDAIAPTALAFKNSRTFQMGGIFGAVSFLSITASDLSDQLLKDFLDMDSSQIVTMHIQSVDQNKAIKTIKHTITELDRSKIEEQKKAVRAGYDMDVLPSDLATYGRDAKALLKELQSQNERMFLVTFLVLNTGKTEQELENNVFQASSIAQKHNCELCRLDFQQEQGLMSSLPLADCQIEIQRGLTTSSTAIFVPFTTQELFDGSKESLYYGLNALSNNLIMVDRKKLKNPNGLILGTPGSGKSFSAKREICNAFLVTDDDIVICDPECEYAPLVERLHGQVIHISPASTQYINPLDINSNYSEEDNPLALKADFVLSLCELVVGGKEGLQPVEKTVIDRCVHTIYRKYFEDPIPENMPLLEDLYNALLTQDEPEARHVAAALEIYVKGSLNIFNHHTNVDINNRIVCFDIKQLGKQLKKLGIANIAITSLSSTMTVFSGQNLGAENHRRLCRGAWLIPLCAGTITFSAGILVTIFCNPLLALFTRDAAVLDFAMRYIHIVLPFTWMYAVMNVIMCFSNGIGEIKYPTTVNLFILWGVRIPVAYLLSQIGYGGYAMASVPLSFLSGMILMLFYFRTKRWAELRALAKNEP